MLLANFQYHCRICLTTLHNENDNDESTPKYVSIKKFPEIERLFMICLQTAGTTVDHDLLEKHAPNICLNCLNKWLEFVKHYWLAVRSSESFQKAQAEVAKTLEIESNDDNKFSEIFLSTDTTDMDVEKYETTSPFYEDSLPSCPGESISHLNEDAIETSSAKNCTDSKQSVHRKLRTLNSCNKLKKPKNKRQICRINKRCRRIEDSDIVENSKAKENSGATSSNSSRKKMRYHCEICKKFFYEINRYEGHIKQVHEGVSKPYSCQVEDCNKTYSKYKNLTYHIAENHMAKDQEEVYKCEECNEKIFKTNETLRQHIRNQHARSKDDPKVKDGDSFGENNKAQTGSICDQCGFIAAHQYTLAQHIKNKHMEAQKVKCEYCPKVFKSQSYLKYHMLSHNPASKKPFQCTECPMAFGRRTLLNIHKRTHLNYNERLKCDFEGCNVRFVKPADKRLHMRLVHLKVKKHVCDFCGEAFGAMQTLRHHRYIHTGEKPYKCSVCGQGFRQHTAMKTHRKGHFGKGEEVGLQQQGNEIAQSSE
ncbi:zinc finger protein 626 [Stomoxys calcitrans]|uniref:zinc finger protein 626 n=1 Tax=Stomoxys calcitrans TaxID=35570 RepID=UPI0027E3A702|nr:zinc finger protein 626 [Stomoxys calcitrans]